MKGYKRSKENAKAGDTKQALLPIDYTGKTFYEVLRRAL